MISLLLAFLFARALAAPLPPELTPWAGWVLDSHPALHCPVIDEQASCIWPGLLDLDLDEAGGRFTLSVQVDRQIAVPLPGGAGAWPQDVEDNGKAVPVLDQDGVPTVTLGTGQHELRGRYGWAGVPSAMAVPAVIGRVALRVQGQRIARPRRAEGRLRLGAGSSTAPVDDRLEIDVSRKVLDGVPVVVETRISLRAAGGAREVDLGQVLLGDTRAVALDADLPARFTPEGELVVQVRPGSFQVGVTALHDGPVSTLRRPPPSPHWPEQEYWAVQLDDRTRAVNLSGPAAIDPARTTLPEDWRGLPAYRVGASDSLQFEELRRGEPTPAPNRISLDRELWLDLDGRGLTIRDTFDGGTMNQGWRLDVLPPALLGHVSDHGADQVITDPGGVELRAQSVNLVAESRVDERPRALPAVGWDTDVNHLTAKLHLPPGWTLIGGTGVDNLDGSLIARWTLFDLFFVLIIALATGKLLGWRWALVALLGLALSRQQSDAPAWAWALILTTLALERVLPTGWARTLATGSRHVLAAALVLMLAIFAVKQTQQGLFPQLESAWTVATEAGQIPDRFVSIQPEPAPADAPLGRSSVSLPGVSRAPAEQKRSKKWGSDYLSLQQDPNAVVQTGPGVPSWGWETQQLEWSGPVDRDQSMHLWLMGPRANLTLALARVLLLLALALRLSGWTLPGRRTPRRALASAGGLLLFLLPVRAQAAPSAELLQQLETRLTQVPDCRPDCLTVPEATLQIIHDSLVITAQLDATDDEAWPVPGPAGTWVPTEVRLDGRPTHDLARMADGVLYVRVQPGVHTVVARGPLPPTDSVVLQLSLPPQHARFHGPGWTCSGLHADGTTERSVQLTRELVGDASARRTAEHLAPWLEVHRTLDLGIPWRVRTEVSRVGPATAPLAVKVPLLTGEAVTEAGIQVQEGAALVTLDRDQQAVSWLSNLDETELLSLSAPTGVPWTELWTVSCSAAFSCAQESGVAPLEHVQDGRWSPSWRPWPDETVALRVSRPAAMPGQTITIDKALLDWTPGRRQAQGTLSLDVRTSQGGQLSLTLPLGARLQQVSIGGREVPIQTRGQQLPVPLQPGSQRVFLSWHQEHAFGVLDRVPTIGLGTGAVNVEVTVHPPQDRWILALGGTAWGPVVLLWTDIILLLIAAPLLARLTRRSQGDPMLPLRTWQWVLLGLGMTQVWPWVPALVVLWFLAVAARRRHADAVWWQFDLAQVGLAGLTALFLIGLYLSIHSGLLWTPDTQIAGNGSDATTLRWYTDRIDGSMPRPWMISLPLWSWRVGMLAWALWLAASLLRWLPWGWKAAGAGGLWRMPPRTAEDES